MKLKSLRKRIAPAAALAFVSALALGACAGGPERAPHQPIKGVDTEHNEVQNPDDVPGAKR
jgi:hypothetical protein